MYTQKLKIATVIIGALVVIGGILMQASQISKLQEEFAKSKENIQKLEKEQIRSLDENKALSVELDDLRSEHLQSLDEIKSFEEKMIEKDEVIEGLEADLISKRNREEKEEEVRLAKIEEEKTEQESSEMAKVQQEESDKSGISSKESEEKQEKPSEKTEEKEVTTASSSSSAVSGISFETTHYSAYDGAQSGTTRGGTNMANGNIHTADGHRIIAVDPNTIPFGSIVEVTTSYGESFTAKADDTGGRIKGNIIDIAVSSPEEAMKLGRGSATVRVIN